MEQITVPLGEASYDAPLPRSSPLWEQAITAALSHPTVVNGRAFDRLPIPRDIAEGWHVQRGQVPLRCLTGYVMFPLDGGPPGWRGRVDVLIVR